MTKSIVYIDSEIGIDDKRIKDLGAIKNDRPSFHSPSLRDFYAFIPPQRESIKDYRRITCEKGKYLAKQPQNFRNEPTSSQKTMNQTVKTMHRIALVFAMESCMKNA